MVGVGRGADCHLRVEGIAVEGLGDVVDAVVVQQALLGLGALEGHVVVGAAAEIELGVDVPRNAAGVVDHGSPPWPVLLVATAAGPLPVTSGGPPVALALRRSVKVPFLDGGIPLED